MESLRELFEDQIKDLYSAEKQLTRALPKMASAAATPSLRKGFEAHLKQTERHIERLDQLANAEGFKAGGKKCVGMEGLIEEGAEVLSEGEPGILRDLAIVSAAQKVEHYEIAGYGNARHFAELLGLTDAARILQETLDEEAMTNETLTQLCKFELVPAVVEA
jgi:ferritin-like metal-binding protein YciE